MTFNNWNQVYSKQKKVWGEAPEFTLTQYQSLVKEGPILDLGIGDGRNVSLFGLKGHLIEGVDGSFEALKQCETLFKKTNIDYKIFNQDIINFDITPNKYSLIVSTWTLNFMKKSDAIKIIRDCQEGLSHNGLLYIGVFSKDDPQYDLYSKKYKTVEEDSFFIEERGTIKSFFSKDELLNLIQSNFDIVSIKEDLSMDLGHGEEHYHGAIELVIRKK